ncbi:MAG: purine-binding chemotaxis protein CheW [Bacteroidales bacterium]|nr:purine-binding chemotaxis protein CheW [Bacteroidales bacterium]MBN2758092.1 purine-binding chemotaxis protein CheW [Bacteroidales bacterium]
MIDEDIDQLTNSYLSFKLSDEFFAVHVSKVLNILELVPITKVPKSSDVLKGVINLRGSVLGVIDIRMKFNEIISENTKETCILVLEVLIDNEMVEVGAIVDSVEEVIEVKENEIQPPLSVGTKYKSEFITGLLKSKDKFIMILDMDKIFAFDHASMLLDDMPET